MHCPIPAFLKHQTIRQDDWDQLLSLWHAYRKPLKKGEFLVHEGDKVSAIYIVESGRLDLNATDYWGNVSLLGQVEAGHLFGAAYAFGDSEAYAVAVQAVQDSEVLAIDADALDKSLATHPDKVLPIYRGLMGALSNRSLQMIYTLEQVKQRTLKQKILAYLTYLAKRQSSLTVVCPLDRQQMADYLAVDRAALSRELSVLQREGHLTYRKNIFVLKPE